MKNEIIEVDTDARCGTVLIAESFGRRHAKVTDLIRKYKKQFLKLGAVPIKRTNHTNAGRPFEEYLLNNNQILFFLSMVRSTEPIIALKCEAIKAGNIISILKALNNFDFGESNQRYVYAAQDDFGNIKIGISNNPEERIKTLNIGNACDLKLVFTKEANREGYKDETLLHKQCEKYNIRSEWFTKEAIEYLK